MTSTSKSVPKGGVRGAIQKRKAAQRKPTPPTRLDIQQYMRSWEVEEDEALLAAIDEYGPRWRQVAAMVPGRSEAMCRNRYQRIMAPVKEGSNCTSRNRCTRCGQMKRGHTCRAQTTIDVPSMPSPLVFDSLGLNRDIERLESPPEPSVSPVPLGAHPGRMTMALAAGAIAPTDDIVMDLLLPQDLDELEQATEHGESSAATSECGDERPASVVLVTEPSSSSVEGEVAPTPVKTVFKFQLAETVRPAARPAELTEPAAASSTEERLADEEVAAALSIDGTGAGAPPGPPLDMPVPQSPTIAPPAVAAPPLMVGGSFIAGLLGSFDASSMPPAPAPTKQASHTLFFRDLEAQAEGLERDGGLPPTAMPMLDDHSPPSFNRVISLSTLGALGF